MTKPIRLFLAFLVAILLPGRGYGLPPLQLFVELTPAGGTLRPPPGTYAGPVVIKRPITLDGQGQVVLDGGGQGTVLHVRADGSVIRGLHITHSGDSHDGVDAGLLLEGNDNLVEDNTIDDCLFGIHLKQAHDNRIRDNRIASKQAEPSLRGEGIRLWYSEGNLIQGNRIHDVRDLLFANSSDNRIIGNSIRNGRIGMEFVFSHDNRVEDNDLSHDHTGIVVLYSDGLIIRHNRLAHMRSTSGAALSLKESSGVLLDGNQVLHCAVGLSANAPIHPENTFRLQGNRFAYNDVALYFYGEKGGHVIHGNRFEQNIQNVAVSAPMSASGHDWRGNFWDDYEGFDRDEDGTGDTPHEIHAFSDRIWMDRPMTRFFRGSPLLELVDFVERLAPFAAPELILRDPQPRVR